MPHVRTPRLATLHRVRYFICPNCTTRALDDDGMAGLTHQPVGCEKCGFGYLFELLEDFFPPAGAGMVTCDREARVLSCGRGVFELTGYSESEVMGETVRDAFGLSDFTNDDDPIPVVLEWGVRKLDQHVMLRHHSGRHRRVRIDLFPAYDEDGGLLISLAPELDGGDD
jgi:PAS domain S-box-containing protein